MIRGKLRHLLLGSVATLGCAFAAHAQTPLGYPVTGLYIGAAGGFNIKTSQSIKNLSGNVPSAFGSTGISTPNLNIGASLGGSAFGAIGYGFGNGLRAELEFDYRGNSFDSINGVSQRTGAALTTPGVNGSEQLYGPMVNILYDFNGLSSWVIPYAGVGVGYQRGHLSNFSVAGTGPAAPVFASDTTKAAFAYQGILGVDFPIQSLPGLSLTADYRIMGLAGTRTYNAALTATLPSGVRATGVGTMQWGQEFNNTFMFGIRYNFGVVPPPPPAAPAPVPAAAPSRSYLVFFDWDKYNLTDRARQIIGEAAANSTKVQYTRIEVNGYTDTSGTPQYNQGLSIRRAKAVEAQLITDGVPANAITIQGFGDTRLLVPTGPGVREPQNCRVEIIIR